MTDPTPDVPVVPVDRPIDDPTIALAALQKQVDDLTSTVMVRAARRPTGSFEATMLSAAPADAILMQGQTVNRADYPVLWQWVQDNGRVVTGLFTNGDGSTTFGIPDFRGLGLIGAGTLGSDTYTLGTHYGASTKTITAANVPPHSHNVAVATHSVHNHSVSVDDHGAHQHGISGDGSHSAHQPSGFGFAGGGGAGVQYNNVTDGFHNHGGADGNTNISGHNLSQTAVTGGSHSVSETALSAATALNIVSACAAVNYLLWT